MNWLFGKKGPSAAEQALQRDRYVEANRAEADADAKAALVNRVGNLRRSLAFRDERLKNKLGG